MTRWRAMLLFDGAAERGYLDVLPRRARQHRATGARPVRMEVPLPRERSGSIMSGRKVSRCGRPLDRLVVATGRPFPHGLHGRWRRLPRAAGGDDVLSGRGRRERRDPRGHLPGAEGGGTRATTHKTAPTFGNGLESRTVQRLHAMVGARSGSGAAVGQQRFHHDDDRVGEVPGSGRRSIGSLARDPVRSREREKSGYPDTPAASIVAGTGFETCDLWVMSPASYRTAPPRRTMLSASPTTDKARRGSEETKAIKLKWRSITRSSAT